MSFVEKIVWFWNYVRFASNTPKITDPANHFSWYSPWVLNPNLYRLCNTFLNHGLNFNKVLQAAYFQAVFFMILLSCRACCNFLFDMCANLLVKLNGIFAPNTIFQQLCTFCLSVCEIKLMLLENTLSLPSSAFFLEKDSKNYFPFPFSNFSLNWMKASSFHLMNWYLRGNLR